MFHMSTEGWGLVGIGVSGLRARQASNFVVTINAFEPVFKQIREHISFRERLSFPSQNLMDIYGKPFTNRTTVKELDVFVQKMLRRRPAQYVSILLNEDFFVDDPTLIAIAKRLLESTITNAFAIMDKLVAAGFDLTTINLLVERLVTLYDRTETSPAPPVQRIREDILFQLKDCERIEKATTDAKSRNYVLLSRCWQRVEIKYDVLMTSRIIKEYRSNLKTLVDKRTNPNFIFWWQTKSNHLLDWGDFLSYIGKHASVDVLEIASGYFSPSYLDDRYDQRFKLNNLLESIS